jgi:hypothetical protein
MIQTIHKKTMMPENTRREISPSNNSSYYKNNNSNNNNYNINASNKQPRSRAIYARESESIFFGPRVAARGEKRIHLEVLDFRMPKRTRGMDPTMVFATPHSHWSQCLGVGRLYWHVWGVGV